MKILGLLAVLFTTLNPVYAQQYVEKQDISSSNLLSGLNPGAENGKAKWTASSAPTFSIITSGSNLYSVPGSKATFSFDASAASQTVTSSSRAAGGFAGKDGVGSCYIKTAATDYKLQVLKNGSMVAEMPIGSLPDFTKVNVPFVYGLSTDVYSTRIISASNAAAVFYDVCSIDLAENNSVQVNQASLFGTAVDQAACQYGNSTPTSWGDMPQVTGTCGTYSYTGGLSASGLSGPQPSFQIADMPAGDYLVVVSAQGFYAANNGASPQSSHFSLYDGTNRYFGGGIVVSLGSGQFIGSPNMQFIISKGSHSTNQVFRIQSYTNNQATVNVDGSAGTNTAPLTISVFKFPSKSEQAQRVNEQASYAIVKSTNSIGAVSTSSGTYVNMNVSGFSTGNQYTGSAAACTTADDICLKVGKLKQGLYDVYLNGTLYATSTASCAYRLYDGVNAIGEFTIIAPNSASVQTSAPGLRGKLSVDSDVYNKEITLQASMVGGAGGCTVYGAAGASIEIGILPSTIAIADHILKNTLNIQNSQQWNEVIFEIGGASARSICSSDPCTVYNSSGGVTSVSRTSAGAYQVNFAAGVFASAPTCVCNGINEASNLFACSTNTGIGAISATTAPVYTVAGAGFATPADAFVSIRCSAPKP